MKRYKLLLDKGPANVYLTLHSADENDVSKHYTTQSDKEFIFAQCEKVVGSFSKNIAVVSEEAHKMECNRKPLSQM